MLGSGRIVYIKEIIFNKKLLDYETKTSERICIEVTASKKKWCMVFGYRPPQNYNNTFRK